MFRIKVKVLNYTEVLAVDLLTSLPPPACVLDVHVLLLKLVNCWSMAPCELKRMQHKPLIQSKHIDNTFINEYFCEQSSCS